MTQAKRVSANKGPRFPRVDHPPKPKEDDHARLQALAQLESIREMVQALERAEEQAVDGPDETDAARRRIEEDPLSVETRSGWTSLGGKMEAEEYRILLCTGGPAVQIVGALNAHNEPETASIQHQDWFKPWTDLPLTQKDEEIVLAYARNFYFGEG